MQTLSVHSYEWTTPYLRNCTFSQVREYEVVVFLYTACSKLSDVLLRSVTKYVAAEKKKKIKAEYFVQEMPFTFFQNQY